MTNLRLLIWFSAACLTLAVVFGFASQSLLGMLHDSGSTAQMLPAAGYLAIVGIFAAVSEHRALRVTA